MHFLHKSKADTGIILFPSNAEGFGEGFNQRSPRPKLLDSLGMFFNIMQKPVFEAHRSLVHKFSLMVERARMISTMPGLSRYGSSELITLVKPFAAFLISCKGSWMFKVGYSSGGWYSFI